MPCQLLSRILTALPTRCYDKPLLVQTCNVNAAGAEADVAVRRLTQHGLQESQWRVKPMARLQVEHLSMSFGGLKAVDDVSFEIEAGTILALMVVSCDYLCPPRAGFSNHSRMVHM